MKGIYVITNQISGCSYVGQTNNFNRRIHEHLTGKTKLSSDIQLLGENLFIIQTFPFPNSSPEELKILEEKYIQKHNSYHNGYNLSPKGIGSTTGKRDTPNKKISLAKIKKAIIMDIELLNATKIGEKLNIRPKRIRDLMKTNFWKEFKSEFQKEHVKLVAQEEAKKLVERQYTEKQENPQ